MEKRRFPRKKFSAPVQMKEIRRRRNRLMRNSFCRNISLLGLKVVSYDFYPVNSEMLLKLFANNGICIFEGKVKVIWVERFPYQEKFSVGLKFLISSENERSKVNRLVNGKKIVDRIFPGSGDANE